MLLGAASFFEGYDFNIVIVALPQLRHSFHLSQSAGALWVSVLYLGAVPAVVVSRRADRHGRRRLLLVSICGYTAATAATALAPNIATFAVCQFTARFFLGLETALVWTMVAEELPAPARGFGFGWLAMLSALGTGWSAILYGTIFSPLGISWRFLYAAAVPVLLLVALLRRRLPESRRYLVAAEEGRLVSKWHEIVRPPHRRRVLAVVAIALLANLSAQAHVFVVDFMQTQRHQSATTANLLLVAAGAVAIPILLFAGSLSDRYGRKRVAASFLVASAAGPLAFFFLARGVPWLFATLALVYAGDFGAWPTSTGMGSEVFPTALRAMGGATVTTAKYTGQFLSFVLAAGLIDVTGSLPRAVGVLMIGPVLAAVILVVTLPETASLELEAIGVPGPLTPGSATAPGGPM
jgi:MFS family permease